jgi:hypothetical protein
MHDADLEIVGDRPGLFDFFQKQYSRQLVAGYSKSTASNGLIAHMADYSIFTVRINKMPSSYSQVNQGQSERSDRMQSKEIEVNTMSRLSKWNRGYGGSGELI